MLIAKSGNSMPVRIILNCYGFMYNRHRTSIVLFSIRHQENVIIIKFFVDTVQKLSKKYSQEVATHLEIFYNKYIETGLSATEEDDRNVNCLSHFALYFN